MAALATRDWREPSGEVSNDLRSGQIVHIVHDAGDMFEALSAPVEGGGNIPAPGQPLSLWITGAPPSMRCRASSPRSIGWRLWQIVSYFDSSPSSATEQPDDPLQKPVEYWSEEVIESVAKPTDADGNLITNSAGDPPDSAPYQEVVSLILHAVRNEATYDPSFTLQYLNRVNSSSFTFWGKTIPEGAAKCVRCSPDSRVTLQSSYVEMHYAILCRPDEPVGTSKDRFPLLFPDQGVRAIFANDYGTPGPEPLYHKNSDGSKGPRVSEDVILNGRGVPVEPASYTNGGYVVKDPSPKNPPAGAEVVTAGDGKVYLKWKQHKLADLGQWNL